MKRIYIQFLLLTVVFSISLQAQTLPTVNNDEFLMNSGGTYSDLQSVLAGRCSGCEVPDLNFNWSNSFDAAVMNETYIRRAADKKLREWYKRQKIVIENFLENKYHKQFSSFNEAKDYAFIDFESKNMTINVAPIVSTKNSDRIRRAFKKKVHIKGLKALKIREAEIKAGNTNKPLYPDFEVNGTPLKNLKSTAAVTAAYNNLLNQFVDNAWKEFEGRHIIKILGIPFNNKVLKTKNNYYGNLGTWDKLDFMQFIIHYEQITKTSPVPPTEEELRLFKKYINTANTVTATYVENYINANKESEMSLFHPNYWEIIWNRDYDRSLFATKAAKNKHQQLKQKELSRLISSTSMNATFTIDYLVSLLKITDKNQLQWLNDNPSKGDEFVKEINEAKQKDADMPPPIPGELSFPPDHHQQLAQWDIRTELAEGAKVVALIKELGITDKNQKDWLYDNIPEATEIRIFVDANKINGIVSPEAKSFSGKAVEALMNGGEVDFEKRIINELIGTAKCIFKKLKALDLYNGTIKQFENSAYDLIITYGACNSGEACTNDDFIDLGIIEIKVSGLNNTHLGFAAALLHEGIHAELYKYVHERNKGIDVNDRSNLMYHYFQLKGKVNPRFLDATVQHEHMADKYVRPIAEAIRELDGKRYPLEYYWAFAWDGLRPYGLNKYLDSNGNYIKLDDTGFTQKQTLINSTSPFNSKIFDKNCN
ncbi:hypothetical protein [Tenacibaculum larymnensis]|uniref:Uncharacterized protein n=1 Tax=Tenacibaculum larymnensis TaxID=2878201 RepID=A0A9X4ETT9_9FLAO|nr:hypothetical protein [Tenacibaculum larymnensis]MDE1208442.1 hypothetical protein [Tenacibaculum larymnensis]